MSASFAFNWSHMRVATPTCAAQKYAYDANTAQAFIWFDINTKVQVKCQLGLEAVEFDWIEDDACLPKGWVGIAGIAHYVCLIHE